ncbi:MAG: hypothetical protein ACRDPS_16170 [Nocardioides sp.]|uniref:hypothetical protein n=1 Tax=Nocardioides sp. TaxID=35761 RepID=UPI003D6B9B8F
MTKWEYQVAPILNHAAAQILNNFGTDGWELVSILDNGTGNYVGFFKRAVQE